VKTLTDIALVALGLVVGIVIGQCLQYHQINLLETIKKIFKR
jgi:Na+/H+-dicarboxylate symporter